MSGGFLSFSLMCDYEVQNADQIIQVFVHSQENLNEESRLYSQLITSWSQNYPRAFNMLHLD